MPALPGLAHNQPATTRRITMNMQPVDSSAIKAIGYEDGTMRVEFGSGGVYEYQGISQGVYDNLVNAPSIGKAFRAAGLPAGARVGAEDE
jgi:hypothetical protein